jgi:hypothetical protein
LRLKRGERITYPTAGDAECILKRALGEDALARVATGAPDLIENAVAY